MKLDYYRLYQLSESYTELMKQRGQIFIVRDIPGLIDTFNRLLMPVPTCAQGTGTESTFLSRGGTLILPGRHRRKASVAARKQRRN